MCARGALLAGLFSGATMLALLAAPSGGEAAICGAAELDTACPRATHDLLLHFNEAGTPYDSANALGGITFSASTPVLLEAFAASPSDRHLLYGNARRFENATQRIIVPDAPQLDAISNVQFSFWIKPASLSSSARILTKNDGTTDCPLSTACRNYEITLETSGSFTLTWNRSNAAGTAVGCSTALTGVGGLTSGEWHHVIIGIQWAAGNEVLVYKLDGERTACHPADCIGTNTALNACGLSGGMNRGPSANTGTLIIGDNPTGMELDEFWMRADSAGGFFETNTGGVAITEVVYNPPDALTGGADWDRIVLYRPYRLGTSTDVDITTWQIGDLPVAPDNGVFDTYSFPNSADLRVAPGEFVFVHLCKTDSPDCPGPMNGGDQILTASSTGNCNALYAVNSVGSLGTGAPATRGDCTDLRCLNDVDTIVLRHESFMVGMDVVAWGAHTTAWPANSPFQSGVDDGLWPTLAGSDTEIGIDVVPASVGVRLKGSDQPTYVNNGLGINDDPLDDWADFAPPYDATNLEPARCVSGSFTTGAFERLLDFRGHGEDRRARLFWETLDESEAAVFHVFRSSPGTGFVQVAEIPVTGGFAGSEYEIVDAGLENGVSYRYGIEMIGVTGLVIDSRTPIEVTVGAEDRVAPGCTTAAEGGSPAAVALLLIPGFLITRHRRGRARCRSGSRRSR